MSADHQSQPEVIKHVDDGATTIAPTNYTLSNRGSSLLVERRGRSTNVQTQAIGDYRSGTG